MIIGKSLMNGDFVFDCLGVVFKFSGELYSFELWLVDLGLVIGVLGVVV